MKFILFTVLFAMMGCSGDYMAPTAAPTTTTGTTDRVSAVTFVVNPRVGHWELSSNPGVLYVPTGTINISGTVTCTLFPGPTARIEAWGSQDAPTPGPIVGNSITITGTGAPQRVFVYLAPAGNG